MTLEGPIRKAVVTLRILGFSVLGFFISSNNSYSETCNALTNPSTIAPQNFTGILFYLHEFQTLFSAIFAFCAVLVSYSASYYARLLDYEKYMGPIKRERENKLAAEKVLLTTLREELEFLRSDCIDLRDSTYDLIKEALDANENISEVFISRLRKNLRFKPNILNLIDVTSSGVVDDVLVAQQIKRISNYILALEATVDWCRTSIVDISKADNNIKDPELMSGLKDMIDLQSTRLIESIDAMVGKIIPEKENALRVMVV